MRSGNQMHVYGRSLASPHARIGIVCTNVPYVLSTEPQPPRGIAPPQRLLRSVA